MFLPLTLTFLFVVKKAFGSSLGRSKKYLYNKVSPLVKSVRGNIRFGTCSSSTPWWPAAFEMTSLKSISWIADQKKAISELLHQKLVNLLTRCIQVLFPPCSSIFLFFIQIFLPWAGLGSNPLHKDFSCNRRFTVCLGEVL